MKALHGFGLVGDKMNADETLRQDDELTWDDVRYWGEFSCWVTLVLAPFLYWVNGPSVSDDQYVVRTGLVVLATVGAVGLRWYNWRHPFTPVSYQENEKKIAEPQTPPSEQATS
jgi:hypothetical protein